MSVCYNHCPFFDREPARHYGLEVSPVAPPISAHKTIRVLLVDDHPLLRAGLKTLLAVEPDLQVVAEADNGDDGVRLALELHPDVVLMDLSLPGLTGTEATTRIVAQDRSIRVLVLTAHDDLAYARTLLDAGAAGFALKRGVCDELVSALRTVAGGGTYVDPSLASSLIQSPPGSRRNGGATVTALSERESEVVRLIAEGHTSKEMAQALGLSPRTLETYKARAMSKLNLRTRAELIRYALRRGWLRDA
jgi:DNA-binding NarL/FixJ family response regulator